LPRRPKPIIFNLETGVVGGSGGGGGGGVCVCVCFPQEEAREDAREGGRGGEHGEEGKRVGFLRGFTFFFALDIVDAPRMESCVCVYVFMSSLYVVTDDDERRVVV
jgi:hypothetical protein